MTQQGDEVKFAPELLSMLGEDEARKAFEQENALLAFSKGLLEAMEARGLNRAELSRRTRRSPQAVSRALQGHQNLTVGTMVDLAYALGHSIEIKVKPLAALQSTTASSGLHAPCAPPKRP